MIIDYINYPYFHSQVPNEDQIRCSSGVTRFTVYYRNQDERGDQMVTTGPEMTIANLTGLETFKDYLIQMTMSNLNGISAKTEPIHFYSPEEGKNKAAGVG